mmetsp:Transcript_116157/g.335450  ORF Transcript_116157/g.335450 Transcript_116157/m.335450 type:complete len:239 (+) Transcript_116157:484-1200(+)
MRPHKRDALGAASVQLGRPERRGGRDHGREHGRARARLRPDVRARSETPLRWGARRQAHHCQPRGRRRLRGPDTCGDHAPGGLCGAGDPQDPLLVRAGGHRAAASPGHGLAQRRADPGGVGGHDRDRRDVREYLHLLHGQRRLAIGGADFEVVPDARRRRRRVVLLTRLQACVRSRATVDRQHPGQERHLAAGRESREIVPHVLPGQCRPCPGILRLVLGFRVGEFLHGQHLYRGQGH